MPDVDAGGTFVPLAPEAGSGTPARDPRFRSESGFLDPRSVLDHLSTDEREGLRALVETELRQRYDVRLAEAQATERAAAEERVAEHERRCAAWQHELAAAVDAHRRELVNRLARESVDLALALAEKVIRSAVTADPDVLVRALETVLHKVEAGAALEIIASPQDARRLEADPELCERLRIGRVRADRRVAPGGCRVRGGDGAEWDATVDSQLQALGEVVHEWLTVPVRQPQDGTGSDGAGVPPHQDTGEGHGSRLD
ncbi:MAG: FliH/SctL family protein [Candidatus Krumholzibacteriia bacterium]